MLIRMLALSLLAPLVLLAACGDDDDDATNTPDAATNTPAAATTTAPGDDTTRDVPISAADFAFSTRSITAAAGDTLEIQFTNGGQAPHSFTVGDTDVAEAAGGEQATGEYTVQAGDTEFHCKYHPTQMKGTITVSGSSTENLDPTATAASGISGFGY